MVSSKPLVSIGMPVYNEKKYIRQALASLTAQTFKDFELIVSDNASDDGTWDILQEYVAREPQIILHRQPENRGGRLNFEFVLDQAQGEYFMWASGHDLWASNIIEVLVGEMRVNPKIALCVPKAIWIDEKNTPIRRSDKIIDTHPRSSAAARLLAMYQNMDRCNALYGLHRRHVLLQTMPWPKVMSFDFIGLVRIASLGHILTNQSTWWCRRQNRQETRGESVHRYVEQLGLTGLAARFPYLVYRLIVMYEFLKAKGSYKEKIALLAYGLKRLFVEPSQFRIITEELLAGISPKIRR